MTDESGTRGWFWGLVAIAVAVPVALVLESLLRALMFPPDFEYLREAWGPGITPWVWRLVPISMLVDVAAYYLQLALQKRAAEMATAAAGKKRWKQFEGLMVSASVAQIPGFIAAFCFMLGADLTAVLAVVTVSTVGVVVLGVTLSREQP
jgi:hypothetical protein